MEYLEMAELDRQKDLTGVQESQCFHMSTSNGAWISAIPHCLNGTELYWEEF